MRALRCSKAAYTLVAFPHIVLSLRSSVDGKALNRCVSKYDTNIRNGLVQPFVGLLPSHQGNDTQLTYLRVEGERGIIPLHVYSCHHTTGIHITLYITYLNVAIQCFHNGITHFGDDLANCLLGDFDEVLQ